MKPITVVTLDDHHLVREGIRRLLDEDPTLKLVGEGWAGEQLEPLLAEHQPDVLLLDVGMPQTTAEPSGQGENTFRLLPALVRLQQRYPEVRVIIVSQYASQVLIESAIELGVRGYLLKSDVFSRYLADAIRAVMRGERYFSEGVSRQLAMPDDRGEIQLTQRQREVLQAIAAAPELTYAQHADRLGISEHTVSHHLRQIFARLTVSNLTAAIVNAVRLGLITLDERESAGREEEIG